MNRRSFLKSAAATGLTVGLLKAGANASIPEHNWEKYDWGSGPEVQDRLYQGPFPQYRPGAVVPDSDVSMVTTPSKDIVPNYGMGLVVYVSGDTGPPRIPGETLEKSLEDLVKIPFTQKIYIRPNWREVQKQPGKLDFPDWWQITFDLAKRYNKRVGFRVHAGESGCARTRHARVPHGEGALRKTQGRVEREPCANPLQEGTPDAALRPPGIPGCVPRTERPAGRRIERQSAGRVHGHHDVRLLGRSAHLAV